MALCVKLTITQPTPTTFSEMTVKKTLDLQAEQHANTTPEMVYCPLPRRLLAMFYDAFILLGLLILGSAVALPFGSTSKVAFHDFWFTLWLLMVCFAYLGICWRYAGLTVGMRAWRIKLVNSQGQRVSWLACVVRFIVGIVSLSVFGLGILWALVDKKNRTWHDLAARTLLIRTGEAA